ncbi:DUF1269 domain-containing protein [Pelomonas sp. CA6]|uniref:DUF1269 domain-containing protein n=1 Tax=Pelomonas sp. CA6 TaxID=2907999 RepID=UPI001F4C0966|nr:DUF1269 domain-containing protein [Pelomonas sp. CA6]MCH7345028.1 DUF1269 domain-containing protein [Pelomonas sp. CA6]
MRKRIYWLLPDHQSARHCLNELLLARIPVQQIHVMAEEGAEMAGLPAASVLQTSDLVESAESGLLIGAGLGAAAGVASAYSLAVAAPAGLVIALAALGAVLGTWSSSMIGSSTPSRRLRRFEHAIARGQYLMMVDVPRQRVEEIEALLASTHPEARLQGLEPNVPVFP